MQDFGYLNNQNDEKEKTEEKEKKMAFDYPLRNRGACLDDPSLRFLDLPRDIREYCIKPYLSHQHSPNLLPGEQWCQPRLVHTLALDQTYDRLTEIFVLQNGDLLIATGLSPQLIRLDPRTGQKTYYPPLPNDIDITQGIYSYYNPITDIFYLMEVDTLDSYIMKHMTPLVPSKVVKFLNHPIMDTALHRLTYFPLKYQWNKIGDSTSCSVDFLGQLLFNQRLNDVPRWGYYGGYLVLSHWRSDHWKVEFYQCVE